MLSTRINDEQPRAVSVVVAVAAEVVAALFAAATEARDVEGGVVDLAVVGVAELFSEGCR